MAGRCVLIRHGDAGEQYKGRFLGSTDVEMSAHGRRQAKALAGRVADFADAVCLCSPMRRTIQTAECALVGSSLSFDLEPDLREIDFGKWEGMTFEEIGGQYPKMVEKWSTYADDFAFPGGESLADFSTRVRKLGGMIAEHPAQTVVLFTHGGVIRSLICHFLGLEMRNYLLFEVSRASVSEVTLFGEKGVLARLNDISHLAGIQA